jgi:hypothetical protein
MADPIALALLDDETVDGHVGETDSQGNAVDVAGITASSSDDAVVTVTATDDGLVTITTVGPTGTATVTINDGDDNLVQEVNVAVGASNPTEVAVTFDEPTKRV